MTGEIDFFKINKGETCPHQQELSNVVSATFEKMGFMEAFSCESRDESTHILCSTILITEPYPAKMYFSCPQKLAWRIAENLYGLEELSIEVVNDMMTELLNTITGSWLSVVLPDQKFSLSIPESCNEMFHVDQEMYEYHFKIENSGIITLGLKDIS